MVFHWCTSTTIQRLAAIISACYRYTYLFISSMWVFNEACSLTKYVSVKMSLVTQTTIIYALFRIQMNRTNALIRPGKRNRYWNWLMTAELHSGNIYYNTMGACACEYIRFAADTDNGDTHSDICDDLRLSWLLRNNKYTQQTITINQQIDLPARRRRRQCYCARYNNNI